MPAPEKLSRLRTYGMVALSFAHMAISRGLHGTLGIFYVAMIQTFGWSRGATAAAISLLIVVEGISHPVVGSLTDRLGPKRTLILGGAVLAAGLAFSSTISTLGELYFWVGVVTALGIGFIGMVPHFATISRRFSERRGLALGIASAGGGLGITLLVPLSQIMIEAWGWSRAYLGLALLCALVVILPVPFFLPGEARAGPSPAAPRGEEWTVRRALASPAFWLLFVARVLASTGNQIVITHQVAHAVDLGFAELFAASIFGLMGLFSILGRLLFGFLADRMRGETVFAWVQGVSALGIAALLALERGSGPALLYAYALLYGLGQGSRALVLSTISADIFLGRSFGAIYGYFTLSIGVGGASGAYLGGALHDLTHSYSLAFSLAIGCFALSVLAAWLGRRLGRYGERRGR